MFCEAGKHSTKVLDIILHIGGNPECGRPSTQEGKQARSSWLPTCSPALCGGQGAQGYHSGEPKCHPGNQHVLSATQLSLRKGHSAADTNILLGTECGHGLDHGRPTAVLAPDINGAFGHVARRLVEKWRAIGIGGPVLELLYNALHERHVHILGVHSGK